MCSGTTKSVPDLLINSPTGALSNVCECRHNLLSSRGTTRPILGCEHPDCPYRYLKRDASTSETFKLQLRNVHRYTGFKQMKKLLDSLGIKYRKVKLLQDVSFITFGCVEDRDTAITTLHGYVWKGKPFDAKVAVGRPDPLLQKRHSDGGVSHTSGPKRWRNCENDPMNDITSDMTSIRDAVTPLWRLPYDPDQLNEKRACLLLNLATLRSQLVAHNADIVKYLGNGFEKDASDRLAVCRVLETVSSPVITGYRNKAEMTIGNDLQGNGPVIGFRFSKYRDGLTAVGSFKHCDLLSETTIALLNRLQQLLDSWGKCEKPDQASEVASEPNLTVFDPITHEGHWRQVMVRESRNGDRLLLVDIHPQQLTQDDLQGLYKQLRDWFTSESVAEQPLVTSLYVSTRKRSSEKFDSTNTWLLFGKDHITEQCCGLNFKVSLNAFFQVNTLATELLYEEISRFATGAYDNLITADEIGGSNGACTDQPNVVESVDKQQPILLDICCGTGTIALCLSKSFYQVVGVELIPCAVEDAKYNAEQNGIENAQFHCGRAETVLRDLIDSLPQDRDLVAVVDPPRSGLHASVVQSLRRCDRLRRIIYVSCNLEAAIKDFVDFARPNSKRLQGEPFVPVLARPVDLFPQTRHIEVILLLQRTGCDALK